MQPEPAPALAPLPEVEPVQPVMRARLMTRIALGLAYSFTYMGPCGRGLLGGGWAGLYFTPYAMYGLAPAKVIASSRLAITPVTMFSVLALLPLAASVLFLAHRYSWHRMALAGVIATVPIGWMKPPTIPSDL